MPKIKTHRGAAKRFKKTGTGKILRFKSHKSHLMTGTPSKRTRRLRQSAVIKKANLDTLTKVLPN